MKQDRSSAQQNCQFKYNGLESLDTKPVFASSWNNECKNWFCISFAYDPTIQNRFLAKTGFGMDTKTVFVSNDSKQVYVN
jgi:hypothetical protein